jgi:DNA-binding NarL/FixJ family response regulator
VSDLVIVAVPDMIFRAKILETARLLGRDVASATRPDAVRALAAEMPAALVIVDLGDARIDPFETIRALKAEARYGDPRVVGFFSHVLVEQRREAKRAGCDLVLPRSAFVERLAEILGAGGEA